MNIRLVNANLGKADNIETSAATWGELQTEDQVQEFMSGDTQAVVRETQNTLSVDQAELPSEKLTGEDKDYDFTLFFITKQSKAGSEDYSSWSFRQLRAECASRDTIEGDRGNYGGINEMVQLLEEDDAAQTQDTTAEQDVVESSQLDRIESKVDTILGFFEQAEAVADQQDQQAVEEGESPISEEERNAYDTIASQV